MKRNSHSALYGFLLLSSTTVVYADSQWVDMGNFAETATQSWTRPPDGDSAPRQGWLSTQDGFFTREWHLTGTYNDATQDSYTGAFQFHLPITRRLWVATDIPFVVNQGNNTNFGDVGVKVKTMFHETKNLAISGGLGARFATGDEATGGEKWALNPHISLWSDVGNGWSIRGGTGVEVLPETGVKPTYSYTGNVAVGQTITPHSEVGGDFTYYVSTNVAVPLDNSNQANDVMVTVTPGVRTHVVSNTFLLAGVDVPVTNTSNTYDYQVTLKMVKGF